MKKLVFVPASYSEAMQQASTFNPIVVSVIPKVYISLVADIVEGADEDHPEFSAACGRNLGT